MGKLHMMLVNNSVYLKCKVDRRNRMRSFSTNLGDTSKQ